MSAAEMNASCDWFDRLVCMSDTTMWRARRTKESDWPWERRRHKDQPSEGVGGRRKALWPDCDSTG